MELREIDALIADKFFEPIASLPEIYRCPPTCDVDHDIFPDISPLRHWTLHTRPVWHWSPRHYTTDPAASKLVREKLAEKFNVIQSTCRQRGRFGTANPWIFQVGQDWETSEGSDLDGPYAEASTEELAVALCALKSVGIDAKEPER